MFWLVGIMDRYTVKHEIEYDCRGIPIVHVYIMDTFNNDRVFEFFRTSIDVYKVNFIDKLLKRTLKNKVEKAYKDLQETANAMNKTYEENQHTIHKMEEELK